MPTFRYSDNNPYLDATFITATASNTTIWSIPTYTVPPGTTWTVRPATTTSGEWGTYTLPYETYTSPLYPSLVKEEALEDDSIYVDPKDAKAKA